MTLAISTLKNIYNAYLHARLPSKVSHSGTLNVIMQLIFHLNKLIMLTNGIVLAISGRAALRPLGI